MAFYTPDKEAEKKGDKQRREWDARAAQAIRQSRRAADTVQQVESLSISWQPQWILWNKCAELHIVADAEPVGKACVMVHATSNGRRGG